VKLCYKALPLGGGAIFKGEIEALSEREALRILETEGVIVTEISVVAEKTSNLFQRRLSRQEVVLAFFELATMLKSGVSIAEAIESQSQAHYHPELNDFFQSVNRSLRGGEALGQSMKNTRLELPDYLLQLVKSGELSGNLAECLSRGVEQMEYDLEIATQFRSALIYPGVLLCTGMLAVGLIFVLVVPRFSHLLDKADDLPWLASFVLTAGMFFNEYYPLVLLSLAVVGFGAGWLLLRPQVRGYIYNKLVSFPVVGIWLLETELARWASIMAALLSSRVELLTALGMAASGLGIEQKRNSLERVIDGVRNGESFSKSIADNNVLSPAANNLIRAGEKTGSVAAMMQSVANLYDVKCKNRMATVITLIEPLAILFIGALIGVLVLGIILAITSINSVSL